MEIYDGLNYSYGVHTVKVSLQDGEYKGFFTLEIGGNCKGSEVLDFDIETESQDTIECFKCTGCTIARPYDDNGLIVTLTNSSGDTCDYEIDDAEFMSMVIGIEIIDFQKEKAV